VESQVTTEVLVETHPMFVVAEPPKQDLWDTVLAQLNDVAQRLRLDTGIHAILRQPERELTVAVPVVMDDGLIKVFTLSHPALQCPGTVQGWHPISPERKPQRGQSTGGPDDLEMRCGWHSLWWG